MTVFVVPAPAGERVSGEVLGALRRARTVVPMGGEHAGLVALAANAAVPPAPHLLQEDGFLGALGTTQGPVVVLLPGLGQWEDRADALVEAVRSRGFGARLLTSAAAGGNLPGSVAMAPRQDPAAWAARRPLLGWVVLVTRPVHQAPALARRFEAEGARAVIAPAIRIGPPSDPARLTRAAVGLAGYDWVVFTSANAVTAMGDALSAVGQDVGALAACRIAAIGSATEAALETLGVGADLVPPRFVAESLLQALANADAWQGRRVLLPRAAEARAVVPDGLARLGASVDIVEAYRNEPEERGSELTRSAVEGGEVDLVTFTSSSSARAFRRTVGGLGRARGVAIGPVTARTATAEGLAIAAVAAEQTVDGLIEACVRLAAASGG